MSNDRAQPTQSKVKIGSGLTLKFSLKNDSKFFPIQAGPLSH